MVQSCKGVILTWAESLVSISSGAAEAAWILLSSDIGVGLYTRVDGPVGKGACW